MKPDHLPADLRAKLNYIKKIAHCEVCNDHPGGVVVVTVFVDKQSESGRVFLQDHIDEAVKYAELKYPPSQLSLF